MPALEGQYHSFKIPLNLEKCKFTPVVCIRKVQTAVLQQWTAALANILQDEQGI